MLKINHVWLCDMAQIFIQIFFLSQNVNVWFLRCVSLCQHISQCGVKYTRNQITTCVMALKVGQGKKDSIKLHIKTATCDLCYLMTLYNKCNFSYHQCLEINSELFVFICGSESRRHADSSEAPVWKWCARQEEWQRQ